MLTNTLPPTPPPRKKTINRTRQQQQRKKRKKKVQLGWRSKNPQPSFLLTNLDPVAGFFQYAV